MPLWGFLLSFLAAAMWAASPIMVNHGIAISRCSIHEINPFRAVAFFIASLAIVLIYTGGKMTFVASPLVYFYILAGVSAGNLFGDLLYFTAIREIGVSLAVPVANGYPILVVFTSWLMLGEPVTLKLLWGTTAVVSCILLLRFGVKKSNETDDAAGCLWSISSPLTKLAIITSGLSAIEITFYRSVAALFGHFALRERLMRLQWTGIAPIIVGSVIVGI